MFGVMYSLFPTLGYAKTKFPEAVENNECKQRYRHNEGLTYTDSKGHSRLLSTNEIVLYSHLSKGDYILEDITGNVIKNFTQEKRKNRQ